MLTFKQARAEARSMKGACVGRYKDGGWFVTKAWTDARNVYYVRRDGSLYPLTKEAEIFLKKKKKGIDK